MNAAFAFAGVELVATLDGALWWPAESTLVAADLHLEKGTGCAARHGVLLPPYDSRATLMKLARLVEALSPRRVIALGDAVHDRDAFARLAAADLRRLLALARGREWFWVAGNHDEDALADPPFGRVAAEVALGPLVFRHEADAGATTPRGEVSGHFHPKASVTVGGRRVTGRCFVTDGRRLLLPAFGAYAGGLDVLDRAFGDLLGESFVVHVLGHRRVHTIPHLRLARACANR